MSPITDRCTLRVCFFVFLAGTLIIANRGFVAVTSGKFRSGYPVVREFRVCQKMATSRCPLCGRRFVLSFLELHAAKCGENVDTKRELAAGHRSLQLGPLFRSRVSRTALPSEKGAPGFHLFTEVLSEYEERDIIRAVEEDKQDWKDFMFRVVKNFGPQYDIRNKRILHGESAPASIPLPAFALELVLNRLRDRVDILSSFRPNQLTCSLYSNSDVHETHLSPHNDCDKAGIKTAVVGVCLGAPCTMTLILPAKKSGLGHDVKNDVFLPRRSVYIMTEDALRVWLHAIFRGRTDGTRYSLTFRDLNLDSAEQDKAQTQVRKKRYKQTRLR